MSVQKSIAGFVLSLTIAALVGCGTASDSGSSSGGASMDDLAAADSAQKAAEDQAAQQKAEEQKKAEEAAKAAAPPPPPQIEEVTAHSPKKGKSLEGGGYLSVVTGTRFWAEHQTILNNIRHAMQLYQAEHGEYPKSQDEFMKQIIEPNEPSTSLPELPEGWEYYYDPKEPLPLKMINKGGEAAAVD